MTRKTMVVALLMTVISFTLLLTYIEFFGSDMDLMIENGTGEVIKINSCILNAVFVKDCNLELQEKQNGFINPHRRSYPKINHLVMQVQLTKEIKEYSCSFEKDAHDCTTEISITKEKLACASCTSIY
jgi:hypothetical protein